MAGRRLVRMMWSGVSVPTCETCAEEHGTSQHSSSNRHTQASERRRGGDKGERREGADEEREEGV
eukprot:512460-Rhodomonas_salina.1